MPEQASYERSHLFADCVGVFQGGGCRAAAYAGAYRAARDKGVHFSELAGTSAGSIAAALIAAGATADWLEQRLSSLSFATLLKPAVGARLSKGMPEKLAFISNVMFHRGMYSSQGIEAWVEESLRELLPNASRPCVLFKDLVKPLTVVATDLDTGRAKLWSTRFNPDDRVARAVRASCSIPLFFQPVDGLVDGGLVSNLPLHAVPLDPDDGRALLAFTLENDAAAPRRNGVIDFASALVNAATNGAQQIQRDLQRSATTIALDTGSISATDFNKMSPEIVTKLINNGYQATQAFLDGQAVNANPTEMGSRTTHEAETLGVLAREFLLAQHEILIAHRSTKWVFELYNAILLARMKGVNVKVLLPLYAGPAEVIHYQRELLRVLGCELAFTAGEEPPEFDCFVFDPARDRRVAVVTSSGGVIDATVLRARAGDDAVIDLVAAHIRKFAEAAAPTLGGPTAFELATESELSSILTTVDQYSAGAKVELRPVPLESIDAWARYAHVYKQRQAERMATKIREAGLRAFEPFWVRYSDGSATIALPPVVESVGPARYVIVNGVSRLLHLQREGQVEATCAVVSNVQTPPPARGVSRLSDLPVIIGRRGEATHRYPDFSEANLRNVERVAHTLELLRLSRSES